MIDDVVIREAFHVALLRRLTPWAGIPRWRLKGGVNLRLFFGSPRYSEDMDLDADQNARSALRREIARQLSDPRFRRFLVTLGIGDPLASQDIRWLRARLDDALLLEAHARALAISDTAFRGEVLEFIDEPARTQYAPRWEELQLFTVDLLETIGRAEGESDE